MLASVARVSFKFRRTKNYKRASFSTNTNERIFSSSAMYLPLRLCIRARKTKSFHIRIYIE